MTWPTCCVTVTWAAPRSTCFQQEPYSGELASLEQCILTCHMGSMSEDCRARMELEAVEEAVRFLNDQPLCQPVPETEYALHASD